MASSSSQSPREGGAASPSSIPRGTRAVAAAHRSRPRARLERQESGPRRARSSFMTDYFTVFGLPRKLAVDAPALQRRFYELAREHHPDFHPGAAAARQAEALAAAALVNRAYRALRDPLARVEYLIALEEGREVRGGANDKPQAPRELLEEMLEVQEALEEAKAEGLGGGARARPPPGRGPGRARRRRGGGPRGRSGGGGGPGGGVVVGEAARRQLARNAARTVYSVKRLMGRGYEDVKDELARLPFAVIPQAEVVSIRIGDREVTPPEVSAHVLRALKQRAEAHFGEPVEPAVITVPASFHDAQRQATQDARRTAGLGVLRTRNRPA